MAAQCLHYSTSKGSITEFIVDLRLQHLDLFPDHTDLLPEETEVLPEKTVLVTRQ
jgi:hypothetical protein